VNSYKLIRSIKLSLYTLFFGVLLLLAIVGLSVVVSRTDDSAQLQTEDFPMPQIAKSLVIDNINLVTMSDLGVLPEKQLVIANGVITSIRQAGSPYDQSADYIDAKGAYATPGLFDMHVHIYDRSYLMANLAHGVTSVRALRGEKRFLKWKQELQDRVWLGSNLYLSSPLFDGKHAHLMNQKVLTPAQAREQVQRAKSLGYDLIKAYGYLDSDVYNAIIDEANKLQIPVAKHGPHPIQGNDWASLAGLQSLEHVEDIFQGPLNYKFDQEQLAQTILKLKQIGVPVTPTLETFHHLTQLSVEKQSFVDTIDLDYLNPFYALLLKHFSVERWLLASLKHGQYNQKEFYFLLEIVNQLYQQGVPLLLGSDSGTMYTLPGLATHNEINLMAKSGIPNIAVLQAATINAAKALGVDHQFGSIATNKVADLVIVSDNPLTKLDTLKQPIAVVKQGQWLSRHALEKLKQDAKNTQGYYWSFIAFADDLIDRAW